MKSIFVKRRQGLYLLPSLLPLFSLRSLRFLSSTATPPTPPDINGTASRRRISYGATSFAYLRQTNSFFADKTGYIRRLEDTAPFVAIARPDCFGKSLLCDQIAAYYDYDSAQSSSKRDDVGYVNDVLFKDTDIERIGFTPSKGKYLMLRFNFSAISTDSNDFRSNFREYINRQISDFSDRYAVYNKFLKAPITINAANHLDSLQQLINTVSNSNKKAYVIIDDYDSFLNRSLFDAGGSSGSVGDALSKEYKAVLAPRESMLRSFGSLLKIGTSTAIERMLFTSVMPLSSCVTDPSSFSMVKDLTSDPKFENILGFEEDDINDALISVLYPNLSVLPSNAAIPLTNAATDSETAASNNFKPSANFNKLRKYMRGHFGGYRFHKDQKYEVFNPQMCIYFLDQLNNHYFSPSISDCRDSLSMKDDKSDSTTASSSSSPSTIKLATYSGENDTGMSATKDKTVRIKYDDNVVGSNVDLVNIAQTLMNNYNNNNSNINSSSNNNNSNNKNGGSMIVKGHFSWAEKTYTNKGALESLYKRAYFHGFLTYAKPVNSPNNSVVTLSKQGIFINSDNNWFAKLVIPNFALKRMYLDNITKELPADVIDNIYSISTEKNISKKKTLIQELTQTVKSKLLDPEVQSAVILTLERLF